MVKSLQLTPAQIQAGLDAMSPADRAHTIMKASMMKPTTVDTLLKRRGGQPAKDGRVL
jgi:hypothetical protein